MLLFDIFWVYPDCYFLPTYVIDSDKFGSNKFQGFVSICKSVNDPFVRLSVMSLVG